MSVAYRPWGPVQWLLPRLPDRTWSVLGVIGTEERCSALLASLAPDAIASRRFLLIRDPHPEDRAAFERRFADNRALLHEAGMRADEIQDVELLADIDSVDDQVAALLDTASPHVVIDITSMPKWWFFPTIRRLMASDRVETLVATYAGARTYAKRLASDPEPLGPLPTFNDPPARSRNEELIIGVGFAALSLRDLYAADAERIRYLFPFPPGPPNFLRNWEFLRILESEIENRSMAEEDRWYVHMFDCPNAFDAITSFTRQGRRTTALAPFGPKPLSLAMCMFALAAEAAGRPPVHVYYTQPRRYDLEYSRGIATSGGVADVKGYCLKLGGRPVYAI